MLLALACRALGVLQKDLAEMLGVSTKTISRWMGGAANLDPSQLATLTSAVHAKEPALAARIAAAHGRTLEELGIVTPAAAESTATRDPRAERLLADAIVCSAAEVADVSPRAMRPALAAALGRAREAGLTLDAAHALFAAAPKKKP
jgi:transcriptional regulator with XRE-family HTH domain